MKKVQQALKAIKEIFPEVTQVAFGKDGTWLFSDDKFNSVDFTPEVHRISHDLLEEAADEAYKDKGFPCAYALDEQLPEAGQDTMMRERKKMTMVFTDVTSTAADWAVDPDLIEITVDEEFLNRAESAVEFLNRQKYFAVEETYAFGFDAYAEADDKTIVDLWHEGTGYVFFEGEYTINGATARICADGDIKAVLNFKHTDDSIHIEIGKLKDLQSMMLSTIAA